MFEDLLRSLIFAVQSAKITLSDPIGSQEQDDHMSGSNKGQTSALQLAQLSFPRGAVASRSFHDHTISYFLTSTEVLHGTSYSRPQPIKIPQKSIVVSLRQIDETVQWREAGEIVTFTISDSVLQRAALAAGKRFSGLIPTAGFFDETLARLIEIENREQQQGCPNGRLFTDGIEMAIASRLLMREQPTDSTQKGGLAPHQIKRLSDFIEANLEQDLTLQQLANAVGFSRSHFARAVVQSIGKTSFEYVRERRMEAARHFILNSNLSLIEIAVATGFKTQQHFTRVFSSHFGITPGKFARGK
jgi:AraC family transcriptional regulator